MTKSTEPKKKLSETPLPEKKPFVGIPKTNPFLNANQSFNKSGCKGRSGGGRPVVRKHAARSR